MADMTDGGTVSADEKLTEEADTLLAQLLLSPEGHKDPYPLYAELREKAPVYKSQMGFWIVTPYELVNEVLRNQKVGRDAELFMGGRFGGEWNEHASLRRMASGLLWYNPPEHTRLRQAVNHAFTPRRVEAMDQTMRDLVDEYLDPLAAAGGGDLLNEFAFPLPLATVTTLLGVPRDEAPALREPMQAFQRTFEIGLTADELLDADEGMEFTQKYFAELIARKRAEPQDDLISALIELEEAGQLSADELMTFCNMLVSAGFETSTNTITGMVLQLTRHPDQLELVRENRDLVHNTVEEVLRYDPPIQINARMTFEPLELGGAVIPPQETIIAILGSANRDPEQFPDPDRFDITRPNISHLSFGAGIHHCVGWAMAHKQIGIALNAMLDRFSSIEVVEEPVHQPRVTMRGFESLKVALTSR